MRVCFSVWRALSFTLTYTAQTNFISAIAPRMIIWLELPDGMAVLGGHFSVYINP
jgi:hypothetical protein